MENNDVLRQFSRSLELWSQIEEKAQKLAQKRFEDILKKERDAASFSSQSAAGSLQYDTSDPQ